ncbi:MAG: S8 family serine peptidase [Pseudomonadota bacterium]
MMDQIFRLMPKLGLCGWAGGAVRRVGQVALLGLALILAGCVGEAPTQGGQPSRDVFDPTEIVALVPNQAAANRVKTGASALDFDLREEAALDALDLVMLRFTIPEGYTGQTAIAALEALDSNTTAGLNHAYRVATQTGSSRFDYVNALVAWPDGGCRAQGPVGMLDTGVDPGAARGLGGTVISEDFMRGSAARMRHGTDVASVLLDPDRVSGGQLYNAAVVGRISGGEELAGVDGIMKALDWLADENVKLVNVSLAGPYNKLLDRSVTAAVQRGMTIVAAVGNDGADGPPRYPAALDNVIAVTAVDANREIYRNAVRGAHVDIAAPGVDIPSAERGRVRFVSGTSMAVPLVTARIAADPSLFGRGAGRIRSALAQGSEDLGAPGSDPVFGSGLMRASGACR